MNKKAFYFEIHDLLNQFVAAFDDVIISRYNKSREEKEKIKVRYVHAPKNRVIHDLANKAQNITTPVISVSIGSVDRDEGRVFNKITGMYLPASNTLMSKTSHVRMPIPVNLSLNVSIIAQYQTDIEQIISNFIPYTNPYLVISWKIPEDFNLAYTSEIRSEVLWSGSCTMEYPIETTSTDKVRFSASTTFTVKGWLFPQADDNLMENIYFIKNNFKTIKSNVLLGPEEFVSMESESYHYDPNTKLLNETEYAYISGAPYLTNIYKVLDSKLYELSGVNYIIDNNELSNFFVLGKRFKYNCTVLLSTLSVIPEYQSSLLVYNYYPNITAYVIDPSNINIVNENTLYVTLSQLPVSTEFKLIVANDIGWTDNYSINTQLYYVTI
jgi:hypothetical protein